jgi:hypothetical protein
VGLTHYYKNSFWFEWKADVNQSCNLELYNLNCLKVVLLLSLPLPMILILDQMNQAEAKEDDYNFDCLPSRWIFKV